MAKKDAKREVVRKYYRYGVDAVGFRPNHEPIDNYSIFRVNADTSSIYTLKVKVDEAIESKGLLVFMNHAYELNKDRPNQIRKMYEIIEYCKKRNVDIMPLSVALQIRGNSVAYEDYASPFSIYVSKNGVVKNGYVAIAYIEALILIAFSFISLAIAVYIFFRRSTLKRK